MRSEGTGVIPTDTSDVTRAKEVAPRDEPLARARRRRGLILAFVVTITLRVIYSGLGVWMSPRLEYLDEKRVDAFSENLMNPAAGWRYAVAGVWQRFDTLWYVHIAEQGYDRPDAIVFFPLYPGLIRLVSPAVGSLAAALMIATVAAFFVFFGLHELFALDLPADTVFRAMIIFAVWPASFTLFAGYADSLAIALVVWSLVSARRGRWFQAGILGLFAGLARAAGFAVVAPLAVIAYRSRSRRAWQAALSLLSVPAFVAWQTLGGPGTAPSSYEAYWKTEIVAPWVTLAEGLARVIHGRFMVNGLFTYDALLLMNLTLAVLVFAPVFVKRLRAEYTLYAVALLILILSKKTDPLLQSTDRYVLAVFPAFAVWGSWLRNRWALSTAVLLLFFLNTFLLLGFFEWALVV